MPKDPSGVKLHRRIAAALRGVILTAAYAFRQLNKANQHSSFYLLLKHRKRLTLLIGCPPVCWHNVAIKQNTNTKQTGGQKNEKGNNEQDRRY